VYGHQEVLANELIELEIVHMTVRADLRRVHDDEHVVRIDMNAWNVVAVSALGDRHRMEAEVAFEKHLCLIAPLRNIEPEEAIGLFSQGRQIGHIMVAHAVGVDPSQLHGESPFHVVSTPRHNRFRWSKHPPSAREQP
jgi:hypothetical protein